MVMIWAMVFFTTIAIPSTPGTLQPAVPTRPDVRRDSKVWRLLVQPFETSIASRPRFWIGIENTSDRTRAVCILSIRYVHKDESGVITSAGVEGFEGSLSSHPCAEPSVSHLVRANEAVFVLVGVPLDVEAVRQGGLSFEAAVAEGCPTDQPCQREWAVLSARASSISVTK